MPSIALAASLAALPIIAAAAAHAKQQCSAKAGSGSYWSWRIIDGRKCWYEGKPMLSKALLQWPAQVAHPAAPPATVRPAAQPEVASAEPPSLRTEERYDPMNAQAKMQDNPPTFDALWRSRIENP